MKKKLLAGVLALAMMGSVMLSACGSKEETPAEPAQSVADLGEAIVTEETPKEETPAPVVEEVPAEPEAPAVQYLNDAEAPAGKVYSELTGLLIDESLKDQRPIAAMVDNESKALPHYGINEADIVYEMMNSTKNGRITRLMCIVKDWAGLKQFGSIRSARTTNCILAAEYNAILCHDGGPFYIDDYTAMDSVDHLSGVFSRIANGKAREYTEYITASDMEKYITNSSKISSTYNEFYSGDHFLFVSQDAQSVNTYSETKAAKEIIDLPFPHNESELRYNESDNLYYYREYGSEHDDADTGAALTFTNLIVLDVNFQEYDENGYLYYEIYFTGGEGWYITDGNAVKIHWNKDNLTDNMTFTDDNGNQIALNAGKTYIAFVPSDSWSELVIK